MGLDIYFSEDIRNALLAANEASTQTAAQITEAEVPGELLTVTLRAYREGYKAALAVVALAFGLSPDMISQNPPGGSQKEALEMQTRMVEKTLLYVPRAREG
jgi:hypothetical protein